MSENKHTPEPWSVDPDSTDYYASILDADGVDTILLGDYVDLWMTKANARRIVACVNRLAQFTTEQIEDFGYDLFAEDRPRLVEAQNEIHLLKKQRDELLAENEQLRKDAERYRVLRDSKYQLVELFTRYLEMTPEELLKEVGDPFGYIIPHYADYPDVFFKHPLPKGYSALMARTKLYTSDQVAAAILKATKSLEDQLAKAEQRVAEAIVDMLQQKHRNCFGAHSFYLAASVATANGEWRKFVKEM